MKKPSLQTLAIVSFAILAGVSAGRLFVQFIGLFFCQDIQQEVIITPSLKATETEINGLSAYFGCSTDDPEIWFSVSEDSSDIQLDFFDVNNHLVESSDVLVCQQGIYTVSFPVVKPQLAGIYFCRLLINGQVVRLVKLVYLSDESKNSARSEWAGFYY